MLFVELNAQRSTWRRGTLDEEEIRESKVFYCGGRGVDESVFVNHQYK